jgi:hypothetical protein
MKRVISLLLPAALLFCACNEKTKAGKPAADSITAAGKLPAAGTERKPGAPEDTPASTEALQKLNPLTTAQLNTLTPEKWMGAERSNSTIESSMGYGMAEADYRINDSTRIHLTVIDCAGPAGAGLYNMQFLSRYDQDSEEEYTKTIPFKSGRAIETCQKKSKDCKLTFFTRNRLLVTLEGHNMETTALKQAASGLSVNLQ